MQVILKKLLMIMLMHIVKNIDCSVVGTGTQWTNEIIMIPEEIITVMNYIKDGSIFKNAIDLFDLTEAAIKYSTSYVRVDDLHQEITEIIRENGYTPETHEVTTSDGYILNVYRIVGEGPPVFLMHGLLCSSDDWVTTEKERALALLLAARGYDVWLGNARGNTHSRRHVRLSPKRKEFWDFSWHEIGIYDLPAMIDHVLNVTQQEALHYIGHSQGTTTFFVMCSERPEYNKKIKQMIALSAVVWMSHLKNPILRLINPFVTTASFILQSFGIYEVLSRKSLVETITTVGCSTPVSATLVCDQLVFLVSGFDYPQINSTYLPQYYQHTPAGASLNQLVHYSQELKSGHFRQYDYGFLRNLLKYGSVKPPDYRVEKVSAPVYIFHAANDWLSSLADVHILINKLPNVKELYVVPLSTFNHMDYLIANDAKSLVHDKVISILEN